MKIVGHSFGITNHPKRAVKIVDRSRSHHETGTVDFIGVDGEGIYVDGVHRYVLFGVGDQQIEDENGLEWTDILAFLYKFYQPRVAFTGFYLGYDFDQWIKTMPEKKAERLLTSEGRESRKSKSKNLHSKVLPVDMPDGWQINMLGKKMFEFRKRYCSCDIHYCKHPKGPWMRICDAGAFFQTSFLSAIDPSKWSVPIVSQEEYDLILKGKSNRSSAFRIDEEMRFYNRLENEILARLMRVLNDGFKEMGIVLAPGQWFGPGQAAQKWLRNEDVPKAQEVVEDVPDWFLEAARESYFGGWFEIMMHGIVPGDTYEYDINSAYPHIIRNLPCLLHGSYHRGKGKPPSSNGEKRTYTMVYARLSNFRAGKPAYVGASLHRDSHDRIHRPTRTEGWFWDHEIQAGKRAGFIRQCHIKEWMTYEACNCEPPMRNVAGLYDLRVRVGKDSPLGKGAKLAYNSMYGKFAQSIGNPVFANPVYASLITSGCRTMINDAIATHPKGKTHVAMVATDAVFFVTPHDSLRISPSLGDWDYKCRSNLCLFKPGVYWDDKTRQSIAEGRNPNFKARGIAAADFASELGIIDSEFAEWSANPPEISTVSGLVRGWPFVEFKARMALVSCLQAIRRHKWELAGYVYGEDYEPPEGENNPLRLVQNANPTDKRIGAWPDTLEDGRIIWRSEPWTLPLDDCRSKPYEKRFGMDDPWSQERREMFGITPEGTIPELIREVLRND